MADGGGTLTQAAQPVAAGAHYCLIDGSGMIHRAWAMGVARRSAALGMEIGAAWLFAAMLAKLLRRMHDGRCPPTHIAAFFDPPRAESWRRAVFPAYKAARPPMDGALAAQLPLIGEICAAAGLAYGTAPAHEADDMVAAYTEDICAARESAGTRVTILSADKDLMQLVRPGVVQADLQRDRWFNEAGVVERFGVAPGQVADYLAITGDASDGIPGAAGLGPKAAQALLGRFGDIETLLAHRDEVESAAWRRRLVAGAEDIRLSRRLAVLDGRDAPRILPAAALCAPEIVDALTGIEDWRRSCA